jgi:hypothetical protein
MATARISWPFAADIEELGASAQAPDLLNLAVVQSHFQTERLEGVGFDLVQALNQFIEVVSHGHDLAFEDADEFPGERGLGIVPRRFVDFPGSLPVDFRDGQGG